MTTTPTTSTPAAAGAAPLIHWTEGGEARSARWRSERGANPPKKVVVADDSMAADTAYRLACEGTGLLWRGDFQNARLLLQALARRVDKPAKPKREKRVKDTKAGEAPAGRHRRRFSPKLFTCTARRRRSAPVCSAWC
jgi:hypothetical protein